MNFLLNQYEDLELKSVSVKEPNLNDLENMLGRIYFPNTYYNSLDFIYKYIREVIITEIAGIKRNFFKKYFTNIEDHRFAAQRSIDVNAYYNNIYPMVGISVNQDFSGAGPRTKMSSAKLFHVMPSEDTMPTIFHENSISMQLSSNIYKYNALINAKFDTSFSASNFISRIYNNIHVNKHYYPSYSELRYRLDKRIYMAIRKMYQSMYENDEEFLKFMNRYTNARIIREFDKATGNIDYFLLLPIRPLILVQTPVQNENNMVGLRETNVSLNIDLEIELPGSIYFSGPMPLLRDIILNYNLNVINENDDPTHIENLEIVKEQKENAGQLIRNENDTGTIQDKVVTMPKVSVEDITKLHQKELKYETTLAINTISDILIIDDPIIIKFIKSNSGMILKVFDENGDEFVPKEMRIYDDSIEIHIDGTMNDTIVLLQVYG